MDPIRIKEWPIVATGKNNPDRHNLSGPEFPSLLSIKETKKAIRNHCAHLDIALTQQLVVRKGQEVRFHSFIQVQSIDQSGHGVTENRGDSRQRDHAPEEYARSLTLEIECSKISFSYTPEPCCERFK